MLQASVVRSNVPARVLLLSLVVMALTPSPADAQPLELDWVRVGAPGNSSDDTAPFFGSVDRVYEIGAFEVSNTEYAVFLNAVARSDPNGLFHASMDILRFGSPEAYHYQALEPSEPVAYVSIYDAHRFANWLHNGQPYGPQSAATTEDGAYTLLGTNPASVSRNPGARVFLPSEDEWYKAAYYGPSGVYYDYPAGSDGQTACAFPPVATANRANCSHSESVPVGSYTGSPSPWGTFDQGGNLWERLDGELQTTGRIRGGAFNDAFLASSQSSFIPVAVEADNVGFRVARLPDAFVVVGDPGNTADDTGYGAVDYVYEIGTTEVTNTEYSEFLNAVAAYDIESLYDTRMDIQRSGTFGSYRYTPISFATTPISFVSFLNAMRFANWLHNGRPSGFPDATTTEDGAYTLGATPSFEPRNGDARVFIASEDEWYKAAYYDPALAGGAGGYYQYPARSEFPPSCETPTAALNRANCGRAVDAVTIAVSYGGSSGPWGTFDQAGNVGEFVDIITGGPVRQERGGDFLSLGGLSSASIRSTVPGPDVGRGFTGFRVARLPEPWVTVGDPGNGCDTHFALGLIGCVPYVYEIGRTEVTNAQYAELLNAVAASDPNGLYSLDMVEITRSGDPGSYSYTAEAPQRPAVFVSLVDAMRLANWLHNGKPTGAQDTTTTEDGAYRITPDDRFYNTIARKPGARFAVPNLSEWYKAAFYDPGLDAGGGGYWEYPTRTDTEPTCAAPGAMPGAVNCNDVLGHAANVGAYTNSPSPWGTFDQANNVGEWSETPNPSAPLLTLLPGAGWQQSQTSATFFLAVTRLDNKLAPDLGIRLVRLPELRMLPLGGTAFLALAALRRRALARSPLPGGSCHDG